MATTIDQLAGLVQDMLEEPRGNGIFWDKVNEIYPYLTEAMYVAALISGEPVVKTLTPVTITANQNIQPQLPDVVAVTRLTAGNGNIPKTSVYDLDKSFYGWENDTGSVPKFWFPYGLGQFGVYPKMTASITVSLTYVALPNPPSGTTLERPISGAYQTPFQTEYNQGLIEYAAATGRFKEGGEVFQEVMFVYNEFIDKMKQLGRFSDRIGNLKIAKGVGYNARVTNVKVR